MPKIQFVNLWRRNNPHHLGPRSRFAGDDSGIDYSEIPVLSEKQLAQFKRAPKKLVAVRLDADVFDWIRQFGAGYSTRINQVLRVVMSQQR